VEGFEGEDRKNAGHNI